MEITLQLPVLISLVGAGCGGAWWMSALYIRVGRIHSRVDRIHNSLVFELGGTDLDTGAYTEGNLRTAIKDTNKDVDRIRKGISGNFELKKDHKNPFLSN